MSELNGFGESPYEHGKLEDTFMAAVEAMASDRVDEAEKGFRKVLNSDPRLPEPRLELAVILYRSERFEEAEQQVRFALEQIENGWSWLENFDLDQLHVHALTMLGEVLLGQLTASTREEIDGSEVATWKEAETCYRRILEMDPDNVDAKAALLTFKRNARRR